MLKRIKPYYFIWLLFPAAWFFFYKLDSKDAVKRNETLFYTSVKAPNGSLVRIFCGNNILSSFVSNGAGYSKIESIEDIKYIDSLKISITGTNQNDTISFLSVNLFQNNSVYTLPENQFQFVTADSASLTINKNHLLSFITNKNSKDFTLSFNNPRFWHTPALGKFKYWIIFSVFLATLIILIIAKPSFKYLTLVTCLTCVFLSFYWWVGKDKGFLLSIKNNSPISELTFFHNSIPEFLPEMFEFHKGPDTLFRTQIDPVQFPYFRLSINKSTPSIKHLVVKFSFGILSITREVSSIKPSEVITNDIDYNTQTSDWKISGNDPYFSFITANFITSIQKLLFLRNSVFLFIGAIFFIFFLFIEPFFASIPINKTILISTFFILILNSLLLWFFNSEKLQLDSEKRLANKLPNYDSLPFHSYIKKLSLYTQDQLPGRNNLIVTNNLIKYEIYGQVPGSPLVYFGKDGWMFYTGENVKEIYENKYPLTGDQLEKMKNELVARRDWMRQLHIHYYIIFPRLPHFIYNEKIGPGLNIYNQPPKLIQLLTYLKQHTDLDIIDIEKPILEAKANYAWDMYCPHDSHWTLFGAYFAYREIINHIRKDFPNMPPAIPFDEINWVEQDDNNADLAKLLCLNNVIKQHQYIPIHPRAYSGIPITAPTYSEYESVHPMLFYSSKDTLAPTLIMNRDSYTNFLIPYFSSNFSRQGYLWTPIFYKSIIEKEKPDIVITEMQERFIYDLLKKNANSPDILQSLNSDNEIK